MKNHETNRCPGCRKHCSADNPRCKYGRNYFEKFDQDRKPALKPAFRDQKRKWKKCVSRGGILWRLLRMSKEIKKELCRGEITEAALLSVLTESEYEQFSQMIEKINSRLKRGIQGVSEQHPEVINRQKAKDAFK